MGSTLRDAAVLKHQNFVRMAYRADTVRNNNFCRIRQRFQCFLYQMFGFHVQCGRGIVQNQNRIPFGKRPRNADTLFLSAGKAHAPFSDDRFILPLHPLDAFRTA